MTNKPYSTRLSVLNARSICNSYFLPKTLEKYNISSTRNLSLLEIGSYQSLCFTNQENTVGIGSRRTEKKEKWLQIVITYPFAIKKSLTSYYSLENKSNFIVCLKHVTNFLTHCLLSSLFLPYQTRNHLVYLVLKRLGKDFL